MLLQHSVMRLPFSIFYITLPSIFLTYLLPFASQMLGNRTSFIWKLDILYSEYLIKLFRTHNSLDYLSS